MDKKVCTNRYFMECVHVADHGAPAIVTRYSEDYCDGDIMCAACDASMWRHETIPLELLRAICSHCCSRWTAQPCQAVS